MRKYLLLCLAALSLEAVAKISLPQLFQSGMVLQRDKSIPVWGKADAGEMVTIRFNKKQYVTTGKMAHRPAKDEGWRSLYDDRRRYRAY